MAASDKPVMVDLAAVMRKYLDMSDHAIECAFSHGQVFLNGRCLGNFERRLEYEPVRGHLLVAAGREIRLGSRPVAPQLSLLG